MRRVLAFVACLLVAAGAAGSVPSARPAWPPSQAPELVDATELLGRFSGTIAADAAVATAVGFDRAVELLSRVVSRGQEGNATPEDWAALHKAGTVLTNLYEHRGDFARASFYASLQDLWYRNLDHDQAAATAASRRALDLQLRSGQRDALHLKHAALGDNLFRSGEYDEALGHVRQALALQPDPGHRRAALQWRKLIGVELARDRQDAAAAELARLEDRASTAAPAFQSQALLARADVLIARGRHDEATEAIADARQRVEDTDEADAIGLESANLLLVCVLASIRTLPYEEALALASRIDQRFPDLPVAIGPFAQSAIRIRQRLAGEFEAVLRDDAARLRAARADGNASLQIEALRSMAVTYQALNATGQQTAALEAALGLERARAAGRSAFGTLTDAQWVADLMESLGWAYLDAGDSLAARRVLTDLARELDAIRNAAMAERLRGARTRVTLALARVEEMDSNPDEARRMIQAALDDSKSGLTVSARIDASIQLARLEREHGSAADALKAYALAIGDAQRDRHAARELTIRLERARYLALLDDPAIQDALAGAESDLAALAPLASQLNSADAAWRLSFVRGVVAEARGRPDAALSDYQVAVTALDATRQRVGDQALRETLVDQEAVQELYRRIVRLLLRAGRTEEAWAYLERGRARSFLETLQGRRLGRMAAGPVAASLAAIEQKIIDLRVDLAPAHEGVLRAAGREPMALRADLRKLEAQFALARQEASLLSERRGASLAVTPMSIADTGARLPAGTVLVSYAILPDGLAAFIVSGGRPTVVSEACDIDALRGDVRRLRRLLADPNSGDELKEKLAAVSRRVVGLIAPALPQDTERLVIVPALWLTYLPFEALSMPDGRLIADAFTVSYLPNASTLAWARRLDVPVLKAGGDGLFLGAIGNLTVEGWPPLTGTLRETAAIRDMFPKAERVTERAFTHDALLSALVSRDVVHFATHGLFETASPLFSGLLVGGGSGDPTRVALYEVMDRRVRARLVVLSACETGLGQLLYGDEVIGLTRTLLASGADAVVSSLWMVADESTALLMTRFYEELRTGRSPAEALRAASRTVREKFPHPVYWAPFIVTGLP